MSGELADRNTRGYAIRYPRISEGQRNFYGGQWRPNDGTDLQLNAAAQDFIPCGNRLRDGSQSPNTGTDYVNRHSSFVKGFQA
jgi:hypothetical protein